MFTILSKQTRITILENAIKQQTVCDRLTNLVGVYPEQYGIHLDKLLASVYGIDIESIENEQFDLYSSLFNESLETEGLDYDKKAVVLDGKMMLAIGTPQPTREPIMLKGAATNGHNSTIQEIIADAIVFDRISESLEKLYRPYTTDSGFLDLRENVKGFTKAFALMGIPDNEHNEALQLQLESIYKDAVNDEVESAAPVPTDHVLLANHIFNKWKAILPKNQRV